VVVRCGFLLEREWELRWLRFGRVEMGEVTDYRISRDRFPLAAMTLLSTRSMILAHIPLRHYLRSNGLHL
jgi:hypothetical protein